MQRLPPPATSQQLPFLPTTLTLAHLPLMQAHHLTGTSHHPVSVISISQSVSQSLSSSLPICSASTSLMPSLPHVPLHIGHRTVLPPTTSASHAVVLPVSTAILSVTSKSPTVSFVGSNPAGHSSVSPLRSDLLDSHLKSTQQYLYSQAPYSVGPPGSTNTNNQSLNSSLVAGASGNNSIAGHNTASINNSSSVSQYANPNLVSLLSSPSLVQQISVTLPQLGSVGQLPSTTTVTKVSANVSVLSTDQQNKSIHNIGSNKIASIVTSTNSNCGIVSNPISSASPNSGNAPNGSVFMPSLGLGGAIILSTPSTTILVPPRPPIGAPPSLAEITDRLQMPPPSLPPPSALRRAAKSANVAATASSGLGQAIEIELSPAAVRQNCSSSTLALSASSPSSSDSSSSNLSSALLPSASVTSPLSVSGLTTGLLSTPIESISRDISTTKPLAIIPAILASSSAHTTPSDCPIITNGTAAWSDQFLCERRIFSSKTVNADDNETDCIEEDEDENKQHPLLGDFQGNSKNCSSPRVTSLEEISLPLTNGPISVSSSEASPDPKQTKSIATSASLGALFGGNGIRKDCLLNALVSPSTNMLTLPLHKVHDLRVSALLAQASVDTAHIVKTEVQTNQLKEFNGTESSILDVHALPLGRSFSRSVIKPEDNKANRGDAATTLSPSEDSIKSLNHQPPQAHPHHHHRHPSVKSSVEVCGDRIGASIVAFQALDNKEAVLVNGLTPDIHSVRGQTIFACMHNGQSEDLNENSKTFSLINGSKRTIKSDSNSFECLKRFKQSTKIDASPAKQARLSSATDVCRGDGCDYDADACESDGKLCTPINGGTLLAVLNDCSVGQKEQKHDSYTCGSASKDFGSTENLIEIAEKHNSHGCPDRPTQQTSTVKNLEGFSDQEEEDEDEEDDEEEAETEERDKVDSEESIGVVVKPRGRPPLNGLQVKRAHSPSSASRRMIRRRRHNWGPLGTKAKRRKQPLQQQPLSSSSQLDDYNCSIQDKSASNDNNSTQIVSAHSVLASSWVPAEPNNSGKRVDCGERRTSGLSPIREITGEPDLVQEREDEHYDESELDEYMAYLDELSSDDQPSEESLGAYQSDALVVADRQFRRTFETPVRYACEWDNCSDLFDSPKSIPGHVYQAHLRQLCTESAIIGSLASGSPPPAQGGRPCPVRRSCCRWRDCSSGSLPRAPFALQSHVLDSHCLPGELENRRRRRCLNINSPSIPPTPAAASRSPPTSVGDQPSWAILRQVELRRLHADLAPLLPSSQIPPGFVQYAAAASSSPCLALASQSRQSGYLLPGQRLSPLGHGLPHAATTPAYTMPMLPPPQTPREGPVTKHLRVSAALVLRNLVMHLEEARRWLHQKTPLLAELVMGSTPSMINLPGLRTNDSARVVAQTLLDVHRRCFCSERASALALTLQGSSQHHGQLSRNHFIQPHHHHHHHHSHHYLPQHQVYPSQSPNAFSLSGTPILSSFPASGLPYYTRPPPLISPASTVPLSGIELSPSPSASISIKMNTCRPSCLSISASGQSVTTSEESHHSRPMTLGSPRPPTAPPVPPTLSSHSSSYSANQIPYQQTLRHHNQQYSHYHQQQSSYPQHLISQSDHYRFQANLYPQSHLATSLSPGHPSNRPHRTLSSTTSASIQSSEPIGSNYSCSLYSQGIESLPKHLQLQPHVPYSSAFSPSVSSIPCQSQPNTYFNPYTTSLPHQSSEATLNAHPHGFSHSGVPVGNEPQLSSHPSSSSFAPPCAYSFSHSNYKPSSTNPYPQFASPSGMVTSRAGLIQSPIAFVHNPGHYPYTPSAPNSFNSSCSTQAPQKAACQIPYQGPPPLTPCSSSSSLSTASLPVSAGSLRSGLPAPSFVDGQPSFHRPLQHSSPDMPASLLHDTSPNSLSSPSPPSSCHSANSPPIFSHDSVPQQQITSFRSCSPNIAIQPCFGATSIESGKCSEVVASYPHHATVQNLHHPYYPSPSGSTYFHPHLHHSSNHHTHLSQSDHHNVGQAWISRASGKALSPTRIESTCGEEASPVVDTETNCVYAIGIDRYGIEGASGSPTSPRSLTPRSPSNISSSSSSGYGSMAVPKRPTSVDLDE